MRAATVIVGAIAAASIFIALAFILSGGGASSRATVTRTVVEMVEAPAAAEEPEGQNAAPAHVGGPSQCNGGEVNVEGTSCEIGVLIHSQWLEGARGDLTAVGVHETISMTCTEAAPVECKGPGGAVVYFAP